MTTFVMVDDGSMGVHNANYSRALLSSAIDMLGGGSSPFRGAAGCDSCHYDEYQTWGLTDHATAWETLNDIGQAEGTTCLACHTVGYENGGFVDMATTPELAGVQC